MSATISDKVMMKEVLKATGYDCPDGMKNKTFEEATTGGGSGGGGGDKLLCYYADNQDPRGRVVYTDKPATQLSYRVVGDENFEGTTLPKDEGKHLFIMSLVTGGYELKSMNLIYEDGSRSENLTDKFVKI